jgi:DNA polymerase-4
VAAGELTAAGEYAPPMARTILHADLDAFYASVEQRDDPTLRGRPVVVGGAAPRGVVCAASYEARRFGVKSAMPTAMALARCPQAVLLRPRMGYYGEISHAFFAILRSYTPRVEGLSLDEAFLDVTGSQALFGPGPQVAAALKRRVREELRLVVSVGVAPSKFVAKIASDLGKPDGLLVVEPQAVVEFLRPLPVSRLWGVGQVTDEALRTIGLRTIGELAAVGEPALAARLGRERARHLSRLAHGDDPREVEPDRAAVSVGSESTFDVDLFDRAQLLPHLLEQVDIACARLRHGGLRARTVTVKVKYADHRLITRRLTLPRATHDQRAIGQLATRLLDEVPAIERLGVRLTGVSLSGFGEAPEQLGFDQLDGERGEHLGDTLDRITERFGAGAIRRAVNLPEDPA